MGLIDRILRLFGPRKPPRPRPTPTPNPAPKPPPSGVSLVAARVEVVRLFNVERARVGVRPFVECQPLDILAQGWSERMASAGVLDHGNWLDRLASVMPGHIGSEDIGEGQRSAGEIVSSWMASPGHRANILDPRFTLVGVGMSPGGNGQLFWTADFLAS